MKGVDFKIGIIQRQSAAKISHYGDTIKKPKQVDAIQSNTFTLYVSVFIVLKNRCLTEQTIYSV